MKRKVMFIFILVLLAGYGLKAQILIPVKWSYAAKRTGANTATLFLKAEMQQGWHIYSVNQAEGGPVKTSFSFKPDKGYELVGTVTEPKPLNAMDDNFGIIVSSFERSVTFLQEIKLSQPAVTINGILEFMACNANQCLPPERLEFSIPVK